MVSAKSPAFKEVKVEYVLMGILGFLVGYLFDLSELKPAKGVRAVLWVAHCFLISYSGIMLCVVSERFDLPYFLVLIGAAIFAVATGFEFHALFLNLPFKRTFIEDSSRRKVVTSGNYALVRHPSVFWFFFMLVGLILLSRSTLLLLTSPLWMALDILWVVIQEKYVFGKTLEGYDEYKRVTPMLIPTAQSSRAFISSLTSR